MSKSNKKVKAMIYFLSWQKPVEGQVSLTANQMNGEL